MPQRDIVVIGGSSGAIEALRLIIGSFPSNLGAAVFVVVHMPPPNSTGLLPEILSRVTPMPTAHARDGDPIRTNRIYIAPLDHHLLIEAEAVRVSRGPRENRFRPAIDPLFRTAAKVYRDRVIAVIVSGGGNDGTRSAHRQ